MKHLTTAALCLALAACGRSDFEKFAYEGCVTEGKYSKDICSCNAKNLDDMLTEKEKKTYKKATLGDMSSAFELVSLTPKLREALQKCAE